MVETILSFYQQPDGAEKIYLLVLLRISDWEPPSCPSQGGGRTVAPLSAVLSGRGGVGGEEPRKPALTAIHPNGCTAPSLYTPPELPRSLQCLCSKGGILEPSGTADK